MYNGFDNPSNKISKIEKNNNITNISNSNLNINDNFKKRHINYSQNSDKYNLDKKNKKSFSEQTNINNSPNSFVFDNSPNYINNQNINSNYVLKNSNYDSNIEKKESLWLNKDINNEISDEIVLTPEEEEEVPMEVKEEIKLEENNFKIEKKNKEEYKEKYKEEDKEEDNTSNSSSILDENSNKFNDNYIPIINGCRSVTIYKKLNKISEGTYGSVYRAISKETNKIVALKHIKYHEDIWEEGFPLTSLREISILLNLKHSNIISVQEVVVGSNPNQVFMVMEYAEHELKMLLERDNPPFSLAEKKTLLQQLLFAVAYMHSHWVIHRDLKSSNLLYTNKGVLKICDFGMARKFGDPIKPYTHNVVTLWYRAPELLLGQLEYTEAIDIWSVGCIMGELLIRKPLFPGTTEKKNSGTPSDKIWPGYKQLPRVEQQRLKFPNHPSTWRQLFPVIRTHITESAALSEEGLDLLRSLLTLDPKKRISAVEALNHPFFDEKPLPQRLHLMPSAPESNIKARNNKQIEEIDLQGGNALFKNQNIRFAGRVDPLKYLTELRTQTYGHG